MPVLVLDYRCCDRCQPLYLKHSEVESIAQLARQQLVGSTLDAIPLSTLSTVSALTINGIHFDLWVDTEHPVTDEQGVPVLGVCEFDPGASLDVAILSVSPANENTTEELVLSTFAHELGHAIFDAPSWIVDASKGPGLFDEPNESTRRAYRTVTQDGEHLSKATSGCDAGVDPFHQMGNPVRSNEYFAELRANEFMGSLLVPRRHLNQAIEELAPHHRVTIHRHSSLDPELLGSNLRLTADGEFGCFDMECLQRDLSKRFGVNRRFIQVRMERYGLLKSEAKIT